MTGTPVTMIAVLTIRDAAAYRAYEKGFFPILRKHGGSFVTFDDAPATLEGLSPGGRIVLFRFPSEAAAHAWYADPDYQLLSRHRRAATNTSFLTMVRDRRPDGEH